MQVSYYTDFEYIESLLRNRLRVFETQGTSLLPQKEVVQKVDPQLAQIYIEERQYYIDGYLEQKYQLPLKLTHPRTRVLLRKCAGGFVIYDLMANYFFGQGIQFLDPTSPDTGFGVQKRSESQRMLESYCYQDNIADVGGGTSYRGEKVETKRVDLPGEITRSTPQIGPIANKTIFLGTQKGDNEYLRRPQTKNIFSGDFNTFRAESDGDF